MYWFVDDNMIVDNTTTFNVNNNLDFSEPTNLPYNIETYVSILEGPTSYKFWIQMEQLLLY